MTKYIGNFKNQIDLIGLMHEITNSQGDKRIFDGSYFDMTKPGFSEIMNQWQIANYDISSIEWFNYYSGIHFSDSYTKIFSNLVKADPIKVWVSEIKPGKCFPYHWDADTDTTQYVDGKMVRYQMMLEDYTLGHFFVLNDITLTGYKSGDVYFWGDYREWHGGGNISFKSKYIYNFLGKQID